MSEENDNSDSWSTVSEESEPDDSHGCMDTETQALERRVKALFNLYERSKQVYEKYFFDEQQIIKKYQDDYQKIFNKRSDIIQGSYELTEEDLYSNGNHPNEFCTKMQDTLQLDNINQVETVGSAGDNIEGIPEFWLTVMKGINMIMPCDEPIIKYLMDIKCNLLGDYRAFQLEFHFAKNQWFTNTVLTKTYEISKLTKIYEYLLKHNLINDSVTVYACKGCKIDWNEGKNIRVVEIKRNHDGAESIAYETVKNESFFDLFDTPEMPECLITDEFHPTMDIESFVEHEKLRRLLEHISLGIYIRDLVIPYASWFYCLMCNSKTEREFHQTRHYCITNFSKEIFQ